MQSHVVSVNVGTPKAVAHRGRTVMTSIFKEPVAGPVGVQGVNIAGDDQADRNAHGGTHKAVYAYAAEDVDWWSEALGRSLAPGAFGENLTTRGLDVSGSVVGTRWSIGTAVLEVAEPRVPCFKLGIAFDDGRFPLQFATADRPGAYLRIIEPGEIASGDDIAIDPPGRVGLAMAEIARIYHRDRPVAGRLLEEPELSPQWKAWARRVLDG